MDIFHRFKIFWNDKGLLILFIGSILFFILVWIVNSCRKNNFKKYNSIYDYYLENPISNNYKLNSNNYKLNSKLNSNNYNLNSQIVKKGDSKGEIICRNYLERRFRKPFTKSRPSFMFNSVTGENLELDCFNKELLLAVEYNGQQHYKYTPYFHKNSKDTFYNQVYRDNMKKDICKKLGIRLIEVPYTVKSENIENYLENKLREYGY